WAASVPASGARVAGSAEADGGGTVGGTVESLEGGGGGRVGSTGRYGIAGAGGAGRPGPGGQNGRITAGRHSRASAGTIGSSARIPIAVPQTTATAPAQCNRLMR